MLAVDNLPPLSQGTSLPMRRDLAQPLIPGVFHGDVRVKTLGDGVVMSAVRFS